MLKVFAGFIVSMGIFGFAPFAAVIAIYALEVIVAFLQAYVFAVLELLVISEWYYLFCGTLDLYSHMVLWCYSLRKRYNLNLTELEVLYRYIYISY